MSDHAIQLLGCRIGADEFCFDIAEVVAIQRRERLRAATGSGKTVGWMQWQGSEIPVYLLSDLLGQGFANANGNGPLLVLSNGDVAFGAQVDHVFRAGGGSRVHALPASALGESGICFGIARLNGKLAPCLAAGRLHPDEACRWPGAHAVQAASALRSGEFIVAPASSSGQEASTQRMLCFTAGGGMGQGLKTLCALSYSQVVEVSQSLRIVRVPGIEERRCILGIVEWRDRAIPVLDLGAYLNLRYAPKGDDGLFAVVRGVESMELVAVPVRDIGTVALPIANPTLRTAPVEVGGRLRGNFVFEGGRLVVPDLDPVFA